MRTVANDEIAPPVALRLLQLLSFYHGRLLRLLPPPSERETPSPDAAPTHSLVDVVAECRNAAASRLSDALAGVGRALEEVQGPSAGGRGGVPREVEEAAECLHKVGKGDAQAQAPLLDSFACRAVSVGVSVLTPLPPYGDECPLPTMLQLGQEVSGSLGEEDPAVKEALEGALGKLMRPLLAAW